MNHSCEPSVKLDCEKQQIIAMKELKVGDELCFFYPSTEWDMSQPFDCWCQSSLCLKTISGAKNIPKSKLNNFHFTKHIVDLLKERDQLNYYKPYSGAPVYPDLIKVEESLQDFSSKAVTLKKFTAGEKVCDIVGITEGFKVWTSVQFGENRHIELNSELVYMNHSCDPSIRIDPEEQAIYALKDLNVNDELSFFYPSTEWEMSQPFDCWCHSTNCLKNINGSKSIPASLRTKFYFAPHIERLFDDRDGIYRKPFTGRYIPY
ncbi:hypothetical protein BC833DRAFT_136606 [Globomyces pollinis-pini]|nr:hypothetical protein BC833DRAFT_136606 [Globomyces pollinis-pini]